MQTRNRMFDDAVKVAGGAVGTLAGIRREIETLARQQMERILSSMDLVTREEFDAVREMAIKARAEQEELAKRLEALEKASARGSKKKAVSRKAGSPPEK
jgi:BMFP domain-containing protein YqiC